MCICTQKKITCFVPSYFIILASFKVSVYTLSPFVVQMGCKFISLQFYSTPKVSCEYRLKSYKRLRCMVPHTCDNVDTTISSPIWTSA